MILKNNIEKSIHAYELIWIFPYNEILFFLFPEGMWRNQFLLDFTIDVSVLFIDFEETNLEELELEQPHCLKMLLISIGCFENFVDMSEWEFGLNTQEESFEFWWESVICINNEGH